MVACWRLALTMPVWTSTPSVIPLRVYHESVIAGAYPVTSHKWIGHMMENIYRYVGNVVNSHN